MSRHQHRTVVKRIHPHAWRWRLLGAIVLLSSCFAAGAWWGQRLASGPAPLTNQSTVLRDQISQLQLQAEADQQTLNELRDDLRQQAADIGALEDMLAFYRAVLAPEEVDVPAVIRPPELVKLDDTSRWRLSVVIHRSEEGDAVYRGQLSVIVRGEGPGEPVLSTFGEVDSATTSGVLPLRFRYLQELQVVISLPEAFLPETIESVVTLTGPVRRTLRRSDRWQDLVNSGHGAQL
ncbi:MAG: hypothetical protein ISQ66_01185 [Luminiphilus sp.]|nr:hypothetical protein [Luminiphilus sp.]